MRFCTYDFAVFFAAVLLLLQVVGDWPIDQHLTVLLERMLVSLRASDLPVLTYGAIVEELTDSPDAGDAFVQ